MTVETRECAQAAPGNRQIIVVDDDVILREVMSEQLKSLGWAVLTAADGEAAIGILTSTSLDLAIVDLNMPNVDGFELLRYIRQSPRTIDLPVIVCTSLNDPGAIERAYRLGASSFVTKPINWPQFLHHAPFVMRHGDTERALRLARAEATNASRTKSAMFQVLSHELKTPLTALIGLTSLLEQKMRAQGGQPSDTEQMEHVVAAAQRLNSVVSDIMLLSKAVAGGESQHFTRMTISEVLDEGLAGLKTKAAKRNVRLLLRPHENDFSIMGDARLLRHAVGKLADNAIRFSPEGGTVELWGYIRPNGGIVISIKDDGPGLTPQKLKECLQPFMQENMGYSRPAEGLGLGLPIAQSICEAHGGELVVQTSPGQGLLAAIMLPARLHAAAPEAKHA
jgi:signal transduction histidine kinase